MDAYTKFPIQPNMSLLKCSFLTENEITQCNKSIYLFTFKMDLMVKWCCVKRRALFKCKIADNSICSANSLISERKTEKIEKRNRLFSSLKYAKTE